MEFDASSVLKPLAAVPDGRNIHCSRTTLMEMLQDSQQKQAPILVDTRKNLAQPWTITNLNGRPYLRGWIAARIAPQQLAERAIWVFSDAQATEFITPPVQITLPLDGVNFKRLSKPPFPLSAPSSLPQAAGGVELSNVALDQHAWEKW